LGEAKKYSIGGKTYYQKTLVYGQIRQILQIFKRVGFAGVSKEKLIGVNELIDFLGNNLMEFVAILLIPEGTEPKEKNNKEIAEELVWIIESPILFEVMIDFFILNQASEVLKKLTEMMKKLNLRIQLPTSITSSQSLQEDISPKGTSSSGT